MAKTINQNPNRYKKTDSGWVVSSVGDSPNGNRKGEIKPIGLEKGIPLTEIKPLLEVDGIIVKIGEELLISKRTLEEIKSFENPHWDYLANGSISVKDKGVVIGKTIPIIEISVDGFVDKGSERDVANRNAGVQQVEYIYEGDEVMGISKNLIEQINYTLNEDINRPGDTFSIFDLQLGDDSVYDTKPLVVSTTQEDGKFDKVKLTTFLTEMDKRLAILDTDFNMIKNVFYSGATPNNNGIKKFVKQIANVSDDTTFGGDSYTTSTTQTSKVEDTPKDKSVDATNKVIDEKTTTVQKQVEEQKRELASTQQKQTLAQQQLQADLNQQAQRTDEYYRQKYGTK